MAFTYPPARRADQVDDYHGTMVADPYRWLEDPDSDETAAFVAAQNAITSAYLRELPGRSDLQARMTELWDVARTGAPSVRSGVAVWTHNDGLQDQPVYLIKRPDETAGDAAEAELFLDPNTLATDGAVAVVLSSLSPDGRYLAYTVSEAGSDRQKLFVRSTETGEDLVDQLQHLRFTSVAWYGHGFFYTRWPETDPASTEPVRNPSIHYHRIGDEQTQDVLVFRNTNDPDPSYAAEVTQDDRYLVLTEYLGTSRESGLLYLDLATFDSDEPQNSPFDPASWVRLVNQGEALHSALLHRDDGLVIHTDRDAPNGAVVHMPFADPASTTVLVAESQHAIVGVAALAGELLVLRLIDASHIIERYSPTGDPLGSVELPGLGSVSALSGTFADSDVYVGYESFVEPPTVLQWSADAQLSVFSESVPPIDPATMTVERLYATSSDGADVGMFVIRRTDAGLPGPVELYGYGGFSIDMTPVYSPARLAFMEAGGIVVVANLRGGTELGEQWHQQGMLANKQQVFDDLFACADKLTTDGVTTPAQLGIRGGSNGGLLTAASMVQRPELFGAVVSQVPVADMLRYQHFTAGRYWTVEYGDSADPEAFEYLMQYSPLHNVGDAASYPPLLITTAESDDRVVPMHSYKLAAEVQHAAGHSSEQPLLLRVDTRAGHGLGKPTAKVIEEAADIYSFLLNNLSG